jgi:hypothetical protein
MTVAGLQAAAQEIASIVFTSVRMRSAQMEKLSYWEIRDGGFNTYAS